MHSERLITSTDRTVSSSAGVLPIDSTPLWDLGLFESIVEEMGFNPLSGEHQETAAMSEQIIWQRWLWNYLFQLEEDTPILPKSETRSAEFKSAVARQALSIVEDDEILIDERIETRPKASYQTRARIHGVRRAEPSRPIGDDIEYDFLDDSV